MEKETYFTEIKKLTWNAAKSTLLNYTDSKEWIFRGQGSSEWPLATSLSRKALPKNRSRREIEKTLIHDFRRKMHHFKGQNEHIESDVEIIAYMQHHGSPTRFLDWSSSPYVASFFAYEKNEKTAPCVWAINYWWLVKKNTDILYDLLKERKDNYNGEAIPIDDPRIVEGIITRKYKLVTPVSPYHENERIMLQQGTFLLQGDIDIGFEDNFAYMTKKN